MKEYWALYKESLGVFKNNYQKFLGYMIVSDIILFVLLIPGARVIFNLIMKSKGLDYITNGLLYKFLVSPQGIILVLFSLIFGSIVILLELGGVIVLAHQTISKANESRFIDIFKYTLTKVKYFFSFDGLIVVVYFIVIAPMLDNNLKSSIFESLRIPGFIMSVIRSNNFLILMLILLVISILILSYRWMFSLHVLLINPPDNKRFLKESSKLIKKHTKEIFKFWLFTFIIELILLMILFIGYVMVSIIVVSFIPINIKYSVTFMLAIGLLIIVFLTTFSSTLNMIKLTQLFHQLTGTKGKNIAIKTINHHTIFNKILTTKIIVFISVIIISIVAYGYMNIVYESLDAVKYNVAITAHRGSSLNAPENTISAIRYAMDNGADYSEIDVQLTKDHKIILSHDDSFKRTAGLDLRPDQLTLEEIKDLDVGNWFSEKYKNEKVPTLDEVIKLTQGKMKLNIEIKGSMYSPEIYKVLLDMIELYNLDCVVTSINYADLLAVELLNSKIKTGYIMFVAIGDLDNLNVDFFSVEETNVSERFVSKAHASGREVHVWTINDENSMIKMLELGVDNIITDNELLLKELVIKLATKIND